MQIKWRSQQLQTTALLKCKSSRASVVDMMNDVLSHFKCSNHPSYIEHTIGRR